MSHLSLILAPWRCVAPLTLLLVMLATPPSLRAQQPAQDAASAVHRGVSRAEQAAAERTAAEPEDSETRDADEAPPLSEEELRLLEAALGEDLATQQEASPQNDVAGAATGDGASPQGGGSFMGGVGRTLQSMNPNISLILDAALAGFSQTPLQGGAHDPNRNGFNLQQLELHMSSNVDPYFQLQANIVFAQFGVEVEEAYARTLILPHNLQARAGQFLTRMGRLNPTHPHAWHFLDQPLVNGKFFGGEGSRGLGAELSYLTSLPWYVELVASANMADGACCARSFYGAQDLGVSRPRDLLLTTRLEQFFELTPSLSLLWGLSSQLGPNPTGLGNRSEIYATDLYLRWRPLNSATRQSVSLQIEAMHRRRQVPHDLLVDSGGYAQLVVQPHFRYELAARYDWVQGITSGADPLDPAWRSDRHRVAVQATLYPSHFSRLRLQAARDAPGWYERPIWLTMLALEVLIGAHGAHDY